jgi:hypothetical protein
MNLNSNPEQYLKVRYIYHTRIKKYARSNVILCYANRCVLERDPIAQKHLAKIQTMRGTYDAMGNRLPPPNPSEGAPARRSKSSSNLSKSHPIIIVFLSQKLMKNTFLSYHTV